FGHARQLSRGLIETINTATCGGIEPTLTLLLDVPPGVAHTRILNHQMHRVEREPPSFHEMLREGYLLRASECASRIRVIDASGSALDVLDAAWLSAKQALGLLGQT
ncbi:MAG TPA: hypothetical protein VEX38_07995, partial [Fimbriimonadaceae bacterium]|nr:hypothetical protein [Fimbriimonadaceae bacterium]